MKNKLLNFLGVSLVIPAVSILLIKELSFILIEEGIAAANGINNMVRMMYFVPKDK